VSIDDSVRTIMARKEVMKMRSVELLKMVLVTLLAAGLSTQASMNFNRPLRLPSGYEESSSLLPASLFRASSSAYGVQLARHATSAQGASSEKALVQIASFFLSEGEYHYHKTGSGVIVHSGGTVLTNVHVIRDTGQQGCTITIPNPPRADLVVILIQDPAKPAEPPVPKFAVDLRGLTGEALARAIPAEDLSLDLAILRINKRVAGKEPPKNLKELVKAVQDNTLELADLDEPLDLESLPLWDTAAVEVGQDVQLAGYPAPKPELPLTRLTFTEGPVLEKRPEGTMVLDRAFATYGFSGGALIEKRSGFLIGILCGGQSLETPAGPLVLAVGRALDAKVQQLLNKVPEIKRRPVPRFTFTPEFPKPGETVTLEASDSFDPDGQISKYEWDLDSDGKPDAQGGKIQRTFQDDARVTLIVTDSDDLDAQRTQRVILDRREQLQQTQQQCKPIQIGTRTFASIRDAIEAAQPGETITVGPGTCQENLVITKSLKLQGAGREKTILLGDGRAPVIAVCPRKVTGESACPQPVEVIIAGFTIRNGLHALQALANAKVTVRESDLLESVQQGVDAAFGADVTLVSNHISHNDEEGFVLEGGKAELRENTIAENGDKGVLIKNLRTHSKFILAEAQLAENTIDSNKSFGVFVTQQARAQIQGGRISRNGSNGLEADEQADLKVITTEILENAGDGVQLFDATAQISEKCSISSNKSNGLEARGSATVNLTDSEVFNNSFVGLIFRDFARVTMVSMHVAGNMFMGIYAEGSANLTVEETQIVKNGWDGVYLQSSASATIKNSTISSNGTSEDCYFELFKGIMMCNGISISQSSQVEVLNSEISGNERFGINTSRSVTVKAENSKISKNGEAGIGIAGGSAIIRSSEISGNGSSESCRTEPCIGVIVGGDSVIKIQDSQITDTEGWALVASEDAKVDILTVTISGNKLGIYIFQLASEEGSYKGPPEATLTGCKITNNKEIAVLIGSSLEKDASQVSISDSTVSNNGDGVFVRGAAKLRLQRSIIEDQRVEDSTGIFTVGSAQTMISDTQISGNVFGILTRDSTLTTITQSQISRNKFGIVAEDLAQISFTNSVISSNRYDGILMLGSAKLDASNNRIFNNRRYGVALFQRPCFNTDEKFKGEIKGSNNEIYDNKTNLCPRPGEYPWPPGFGGGA